MPEAPPKSDMALSQNGARHGHLLNVRVCKGYPSLAVRP